MKRMGEWPYLRFHLFQSEIVFMILFMLYFTSATAQSKTPQYFKQELSQAPQQISAYQHRAKFKNADIQQTITSIVSSDSLINAGQLGGRVNGGLLIDNYAYIFQSTYLKVVDLAGTDLTIVASVPLISKGHRIVYSGGYVYVNYFSQDDSLKDILEIINVSDPQNPAHVNSWHVPGIGPNGMKQIRASGNYLYILNSGESSESIVVVDVSNPASPQVVNTYQQEGQDFIVLGDYLYLVQNGTSRGKLVILDISDKQNIQQLASVKLANANSIDTDGHYAYIARQSSSGFVVYDVSTPATPTQIGSYNVGTPSYQEVMVRSNRAFLSGYGSNGMFLDVLDVADPTQPSLILQKDYPFYSFIGANASSLFLAMRGQFQVFDLAQKQIISRLSVPAAVKDFAASGHYSYWVGSKHIWIYDLTDPTTPAFVDTMAMNGCFVHSQQLFVTDLLSHVMIYDISNPAQPQYEATFDAGIRVQKIDFLGSATFLLTASQIIAVDFNNLASPTELSRQDLPQSGVDFCLSQVDSSLFIAYGDESSGSEIRVFDYSTPGNPTTVSTFQVDYSLKRISALNDRLIVAANKADGSAGYLSAFDVSDRAHPQLLHSDIISDQSTIGDMLINDDLICISLPVQQKLQTFQWDAQTQQFLAGTSLQDLPAPYLLRSYTPAAGALTSFSKAASIRPQGLLDFFLYVLNGSFYGLFEGGEGVNIVKVPRKSGTVNLTMNINPSEAPANGCKTTPAPGQHQYQQGAEINLYALPNPDAGWYFTGWSGDASGTDLITHIVMDGDKNVTANFKELTLTISGYAAKKGLCPEEAVKEGGFHILPITICASNADGWYLYKIDLKSSGSGDENLDVKQVECFRNTTKIFGGKYQNDNGILSMQFNPAISIGPGECITLQVVYDFEFDPDSYSRDESKTFLVETDAPSAKPWDFAEGLIQGKARRDTLTIAPVWNSAGHGFVSIRDGINDASTQNEDTCWVCRGEYRENVNVSKSITLKSVQGKDETFITAQRENLHAVQFTAPGAAIDGFTIQGATAVAAAGIYLPDGADSARIESNRIRDNYYGVFADTQKVGANSIVSNEIINNSKDGIFIVGKRYDDPVHGYPVSKNKNRILHNKIAGNLNNGVLIFKSGENNVEHNDILGNDSSGVKLLGSKEGSFDYNTVAFNAIDSNNVGIYIDGSGFNVIKENTVTNNKNNGIIVDAKNLRLAGENVISYNASSHNKGSGLVALNGTIVQYLLDGREGFTIHHNKFMENNCDGIRFKNIDGSVPIHDNTISKNKDFGIHIEGGRYGNIKNNVVDENGIGIYVLHGEKFTISGNSVKHNRFEGIYMEGGSEHHLSKNILEENDGSGYYLKYMDRCHIDSSHVYKNKEKGIFMSGTFEPVIENVETTFNGQAGVWLEDVREGFRIENLNSSNNNGTGLEILYGGDYGYVQNSKFNQNDSCGFYSTNTTEFYIYNCQMNHNAVDGMTMKETGGGDIDKCIIMHNQNYGLLLEGYRRSGVFKEIENCKIQYNCRGVKVVGIPYLFEANSIQYNTCNTGIHLVHSKAIIRQNLITDDSGGDGIVCEQGAQATISRNNIYNNKGYGVNNMDAAELVLANNNWWGSVDGPGASDVSGNVETSRWLSSPVGVIASIVKDTLWLAPGAEDSVRFFVMNLQDKDDNINVTLSEDFNWLQNPDHMNLPSKDSLGASSVIKVAVPENAVPGAANRVRIIAVSASNPQIAAADSFLVLIYRSALDRIKISPDSVTMAPGWSRQFFAVGYDSLNHPIKGMSFNWSATGGSIDSSGFFTAGDDTGRFVVTAEDPATHMRGSAIIYISTTTGMQNKASAIPLAFRLYQNYPNPFNPITTIKFAVKQRSHVILKLYDIRGREIMTLVDDDYSPGEYRRTLDAHSISTGVYFLRIRMNDFVAVKKLVIMK